MITTQAREVRDALCALGLQSRKTRRGGLTVHADFHVRTEGSGSDPRSGFGDAFAYIYTPVAHEKIVANAARLAERGLIVTILRRGDRIISTVVGSGPGQPRINEIDLDGEPS